MLYPIWADTFDFPVEGDAFIHHPVSVLPEDVRDDLAQILNTTCKWKILCELMRFSSTDEERGSMTPGVYFMMKLCDSDRTVTDLFIHLARVKCLRAMIPLKDYVDEKYQILLDEADDLKTFLKKLSLHLEYNYRKEYLVECGAGEGGAIRPLDICDYMYCIGDSLEVPYREIEKMTRKFATSMLVQRGTFSNHFRANVGRRQMLVKRFRFCQMHHFELDTHQLEVALKDLKFLQLYKHENILSLWGFGFQADEMSIVYTYSLQYSLDYHIHIKYPVVSPLPFYRRFYICRDLARGLSFLHTHRDRPLIHMSIRPENIFLDLELRPKISNFGLAREGPLPRDPPAPTEILYEYAAHLPIEYLCWPHYISTKLDVFSFGVTMLQLMSCRFEEDRDGSHIRNYVHTLVNRDRSLDDVIDTGNRSDNVARAIGLRLMYIGYLCTKQNYNLRPEMKNVFTRLMQLL